MGRLSGKIAMITGAASGIGRACAIRMAADGALVTIADINMEGGAQVVAEIANAGGKADTVHCDITTEESIKAESRAWWPNMAGSISSTTMQPMCRSRYSRRSEENTSEPQ